VETTLATILNDMLGEPEFLTQAPKHNLQAFWNGYAAPYSLLRESRVYEKLMRETLSLARIGPGMKSLDLACGPGHYACELAKQGAQVTAVDYSDKMIAIAQKNISLCPPLAKSITLIRMDALDYLKTVPDNYFDVVIAALFVSYIEQPSAVIAEIHRALKPAGRLLMSNPKPNANFSYVLIDSICDILRKPLAFFPVSLQIWLYAKRIERYSKTGVFSFFSQTETCRLLVGAGFELEKIKLAETFSGQAYLACAEK
jgi:ubiquinone/menaquinone biosynthesis C-methylase UbiE